MEKEIFIIKNFKLTKGYAILLEKIGMRNEYVCHIGKTHYLPKTKLFENKRCIVLVENMSKKCAMSLKERLEAECE